MSVAGLINPLALQQGEPDEEQLREQARSMKGTAQGMAAGAAGLPGEIENIASALMDMKQGMAPGILPNETTLPTSRDVGEAMGAPVDSPEFAVGEVFAPDPTGPMGKVAKAAPYLSHILPIFFAADKFEKIGDVSKANRLRSQAKIIQDAIDRSGGKLSPEQMDKLHEMTGHHIQEIKGKQDIFYEVDDTGMTLKDPNFIAMQTGDDVKVSDVYDHPELFKLVPEAGDAPFRADPTLGPAEGGSNNPITDEIIINANTPEKFQDVIAHETEHVVQKYSDQMEGGGPDMFRDPQFPLRGGLTEYLNKPGGAMQQVEEALTAGESIEEVWSNMDNFWDNLTQQSAQAGMPLEKLDEISKAERIFDQVVQAVIDGDVPMQEMMNILDNQYSDSFRNYERLTGEINARIAGKKATTGKMEPLHRGMLNEGNIYKPEQAISYQRKDYE